PPWQYPTPLFRAAIATSLIYTLSLHDALPIFEGNYFSQRIPIANPTPIIKFRTPAVVQTNLAVFAAQTQQKPFLLLPHTQRVGIDRKSTRLNSSHVKISYAVFCLKKKKTICRI